MRLFAAMLVVIALPLCGADVSAAGPEAATSIVAAPAVSPALTQRLRSEAPPERPLPPTPRLWKASVAALVIAAVADAATSFGKRELNPALRGANGRFGGRGIAIKSVVTGSALAGQWLLVRRTPESGRYAAIANFGIAGVFSAAAIHNAGNRGRAEFAPAPTPERAAPAATLAK